MEHRLGVCPKVVRASKKRSLKIAALAFASCGFFALTALQNAQAAPIRRRPLVVNPATTATTTVTMAASRPNYVINAPLRVSSSSILRLRGLQGVTQLSKIVTVRGYYYDGSIPMIVDNIRRTQMDMIMPVESYIPLARRVPMLRSGDHVSIIGRLVTPAAAGLNLRNEPSVLRIEGAPSASVRVIKPALKIMSLMPSRFRIPSNFKLLPRKYAVLMAGGYDEANNHIRYWNDLSTMYQILRARGYAASHITVLYADGNAKDNSMPVDYSATADNVRTVFNNLGAKMNNLDDLYLMLNDHGGGFLDHEDGGDPPGNYGGVLDPSNSDGKAISEADYGLDLNGNGTTNDVVHFHNTVLLWGDSMTDVDFSNALSAISRYHEMKIQMKQCFCGGFAYALAAPKRVVMASAGPNEVSWAYGNGQYGEFTYWYFSALTGQTPDGAAVDPDVIGESQAATLHADLNGDGQVSLLEAYKFARYRDKKTLNSIETPYYTDNGNAPISGPVIAATGQGALGGSSFVN